MAPGADLGLDRVGVEDRRLRLHAAVQQGGVGADLTARADLGGADQVHARGDGGVRADGHVRLDPRAGRTQEGHPGASVVFDDAALGQLLGGHQVSAIVDAEGDRRVVGHVGDDRLPLGVEEREDAGEIALARLVTDLVEGHEQVGRLEHVGAQVDLPDRELLGGNALGVLRLHDALEVALSVADDAPVAGGVEPVGGEQGRARALGRVVGDERPQRLGGDQRLVAGENHHGPARRPDPGRRARRPRSPLPRAARPPRPARAGLRPPRPPGARRTRPARLPPRARYRSPIRPSACRRRGAGPWGSPSACACPCRRP